MQRKYIYANLEKLDNLVFAYGIDQSDFVHGIKRLPANLVSLVGVDDNEHAVNAHTGLNVINDENEIRRYLLQSHALPVKWLDYDEVGDLDFLTATEIAELLYLGHMDRQFDHRLITNCATTTFSWNNAMVVSKCTSIIFPHLAIF